VAVQHTPPPPKKYICEYKKFAKFGETTFLKKKLEREFYKLTFGNSEFVKWEIP
jgi:hypothetical protein